MSLLNTAMSRGERDGDSAWQLPGRLPRVSGSLNAVDLLTYESADAVISGALCLKLWPLSLAALMINGIYVEPEKADEALNRIRGLRRALAPEVPEVEQVMVTCEALDRDFGLAHRETKYISPDEVLRTVARGDYPNPKTLPGLAARAHAVLVHDHQQLMKKCEQMAEQVNRLRQEGSGASPHKVSTLEQLVFILVQRDGIPRKRLQLVKRTEAEITKATAAMQLERYTAPTTGTLRAYLTAAAMKLGVDI